EAEAAIQVRSGVLELTERVVDAGPLQVGILERGAAGRVRLEGAIEGLQGLLQLSDTGVGQAEAVVADAEEGLGRDGRPEGGDGSLGPARLQISPAEVAPGDLRGAVEDVGGDGLEQR